MFELAAEVAVKKKDKRHHRIGAVAVRKDGTIVTSSNGPATSPTWKAHAEARLLKKLDKGASVWLVRVRRDGSYGCAKPCRHCMRALISHGVSNLKWTS